MPSTLADWLSRIERAHPSTIAMGLERVAKVRDAIESTKGFVGTGGIVNMSPGDHMGLDLTYFRMLEVKKGNWVPVQ